MNILILSWRGPGHPNAGGAEISTHEHAKAWVKAGHTVILFTSFYKGARKEEVIDGVQVLRSGRQNFGVHFNVFKWYCFKNHPKFDLVIDQFHGIPFFTPFFVKTKKLGFIHEVTKEVWKLNQWPFPLNFAVTILGTLLEPLIFKFYKTIPFLTVSNSSKEDLIEWGIPDEKINVIHNGINLPKSAKISAKESKKTIIYLGALAKDKGIEKALKIFSLLIKEGDFQFWIVGKAAPQYLDELKTKAKSLGLDKKIKFWGFVTEDKKFELLSKSHLLINPSIREGWGLVVIEAAAVGTPSAAYKVAGLKDSILDGKTGVLVENISIESLSEKILTLFKNEDKLNQLGKNSITWSKNFSWEKSTKQSLELIKKVAES